MSIWHRSSLVKTWSFTTVYHYIGSRYHPLRRVQENIPTYKTQYISIQKRMNDNLISVSQRLTFFTQTLASPVDLGGLKVYGVPLLPGAQWALNAANSISEGELHQQFQSRQMYKYIATDWVNECDRKCFSLLLPFQLIFVTPIVEKNMLQQHSDVSLWNCLGKSYPYVLINTYAYYQTESGVFCPGAPVYIFMILTRSERNAIVDT